MCLELRKTVRRGRSAVPLTLLRTCRRRRSWRRCLVFCWSMTRSLLAACGLALAGRHRLLLHSFGKCYAASGLRRPAGERFALFTANLLAFIHDALALVRFRLADGADFGGE